MDEAVRLLSLVLDPQEKQIWMNLGECWNIPRSVIFYRHLLLFLFHKACKNSSDTIHSRNFLFRQAQTGRRHLAEYK